MADFTPLLDIAVTHAYFAGGHCRGLRLTPTADTLAWLHEINGLCRESGSGLIVLGDASRHRLSTARPQGLGWFLRCDDSGFAAVTAGLPPHGARLELMWLKPAPDASPTPTARLHVAPEAGAGDIWPLTWPMVAAQLGPAERRWPPLALVQVPVPAGGRDGGAPSRYTIHFGARAPRWKYCLVGHWSDDPLEVVASGGALSTAKGESPFGAPESGTLPDGRPMLVFLSNQGIELRERPERHFSLRSAADKRVVLERLPTAGAGQLALEPIGGGRALVSEIHVHR